MLLCVTISLLFSYKTNFTLSQIFNSDSAEWQWKHFFPLKLQLNFCFCIDNFCIYILEKVLFVLHAWAGTKKRPIPEVPVTEVCPSSF